MNDLPDLWPEDQYRISKLPTTLRSAKSMTSAGYYCICAVFKPEVIFPVIHPVEYQSLMMIGWPYRFFFFNRVLIIAHTGDGILAWVTHGQTASAGNHVVPGFSGCSRRIFREPKSCLAMGRVRTKTVKKAWCWIQPIQLDPIFTTGVWSRNAWTLGSMEASWRNHSDIFWIPFERIAAGCPRDRGEVLRQTDPGLPVPWTIRSRWALGLWVNGWHWVKTTAFLP